MTTSLDMGAVFSKDTLLDGKPVRIKCVEINGQTYSISGGPLNVLSLEDEWFEDIKDPEAVIAACGGNFKADLFTFWQRVPEEKAKYPYYHEWESLAVLPVSTFDHWFNKQIKGTTRNMVRKSQKAGVEVRECAYDEAFIKGMVEIFNETPVRQGRAFWHYRKDFETVKRQFSRFLFREDLIGAFHGDEMVGFVMLGNGGNFGLLGQFLSKLKHRDKAINNGLIAETVKVCEKRKLPYLVYGYWAGSSLGDFKHNSAFVEMKVPRYFVPLTAKGKLALQFRLHKGVKAAMPDKLKARLKQVRKFWLEFRAKD